MTAQDIAITVDRHVATIEIRRPPYNFFDTGLIRQIAECAPLGLLATRATLRAGLADRVLAATDHETAEQTRLRSTEDFREGVRATEERRPANFVGR